MRLHRALKGSEMRGERIKGCGVMVIDGMVKREEEEERMEYTNRGEDETKVNE